MRIWLRLPVWRRTSISDAPRNDDFDACERRLDEVREAARAFVASGLQPGDRASVWAPNIHQWIVAALGLYSAGGVLVPLNTRFRGTEWMQEPCRSWTRWSR